MVCVNGPLHRRKVLPLPGRSSNGAMGNSFASSSRIPCPSLRLGEGKSSIRPAKWRRLSVRTNGHREDARFRAPLQVHRCAGNPRPKRDEPCLPASGFGRDWRPATPTIATSLRPIQSSDCAAKIDSSIQPASMAWNSTQRNARVRRGRAGGRRGPSQK